MSDAKKCDRCGAFYVQNREPNYKVTYDDFGELIDPITYDLCDNCTMKLEAFLKGVEKLSLVDATSKSRNVSEELNKRGCRNEYI